MGGVPSFGMTLWHVLAALTAIALPLRNWRMFLLGSVLLGDWTLGTFVVPPQPDSGLWLCWWGYALVDFAAVILIAMLARSYEALAIAALLWLSMWTHLVAGVIMYLNGSLALGEAQAWWDFNHWAAWLEAWALTLIGGRNIYGAIVDWASVRSAGCNVRAYFAPLAKNQNVERYPLSSQERVTR